MKVCILTSTHKWNDNRVFYKETLSLAEFGYDVVYIAQEASCAKKVNEHIHCVDLPLKNKLGSTSLKGMLNIYKIAKREQCDVYHLQDPDLIYVGLLLKMTTKSKVIYDVHEDYPSDMLTKYYLKPFLRKMLSKAMAFSEWLADRFFDAIVTADNFVFEQFSAAKTVILYNYPDTKKIDEALEQASEPAEKKWDVIFPGATSEFIVENILRTVSTCREKGREIKAAIISPFVLKGGIDGVRHRMKELNLDETNVYLQSRVPTYEVPRLILSAKIGLIPLPNTKKMSRNIPTKLFEYWYCGVPVVASDLPPIAQYVQKADGAYLVKPDDVEAWAEKIIALLDASHEAEMMAEKGRTLVVNECNWEVEKTKLKALYDTLNS